MGRMIDEEDLKRKINSLLLVFLELDVFSSMLPSMPKGEIVRRIVGSMNDNDIPMGDYCRYVTMMIGYIHD